MPMSPRLVFLTFLTPFLLKGAFDSQSWGWVLEIPLVWPSFFKYFRQFTRQARTCGQVRAPGPTRPQVLQNSGSRMFMFRVKTLSVRDRHWRNPRKRKYRECSNIKSARVSALTGSVAESVPRKTAKGWRKDSAPRGYWTWAPRLTSTHLNHSAMGKCQSTEKKWYLTWRHCVSQPANALKNLKFRTDLRDRVMDGWSVTQ